MVANEAVNVRDFYEQTDNSEDFMAESMKEAEKEVKEGKTDLTAQIA
jgi:hypothetical protein